LNITWLGIAAGILTSFAVLPQLIKTWHTKHAEDISIWQLIMLAAGTFLWLIYGIVINDLPLKLANGFSSFCYLLLICMKVVYDKRAASL